MTALDGARRVFARVAGRRGEFRSQGMMVMIVRVAGAGLALVAQVLASRLVGAEGFGQYALVLVWLLLLGHGATAGTNQLLTRFLAQYTAAGETELAAGLVRFSVAYSGSIATILALSGIALVHSGPLGLESDMRWLATLGIVGVPLLVVQEYLESVSRGLDRPLLGIAPAMLTRHVAILVGVGVAFALAIGADGRFVMTMTIVGLLVSIGLQAALLARHLRAALAGAAPSYRVRRWVSTALPIALVEASETLFLNADILILGLFVPHEYVAYYFAATRIAQILSYVPYAMTAVTAQKYAALAAAQRMDELRAMIGNVTLMMTGLTLVASVALSLLAAPILFAFGGDFVVAQHVVPLLCVGIVAACALGPGADVLAMMGQERVCSLSYGVALAVNVGLNFALIPAFGIAGAALATSAALAVRGLLLAYFAQFRLGLALPVGAGRLFRAGVNSA